MGIKERRTKILTAIALLSDLTFNPITFTEKIQKIFDITLNQKTKATLSSLIREELIEKIEDSNTIPSYKLTDKGFKELVLTFPFFRFLKEEWDGKWRILSYEIPEKKRELRDKLRRHVAGWGLGPWHRSFWLTPHPIIDDLRELVGGREEEKYVQAFESDYVFGDKQVLIEKVWGKEILEKKYRELFKKWHMILSKEELKETKLKNVINEYVSILKNDPGLPKSLLGENWIGNEAFNIFKEIRGILLSN
ncbi:MAG: PaaX family transcriptional regulator C-terminal domain-containing protein [bacterium]